MSISKENYNDEMQERGSYAIIPNEIWEIECIDHTAKVIWCYLVSRKSDWKSSRNNVARNLGMGVNTVSTYIGQLSSMNMIKLSIGLQKSWDFEIVPPSGWKIPESEKKKFNNNRKLNMDETGSNQIQSSIESNTESNIDPVLDLGQIHTQEAIIKTSLPTNCLNSKESRNIGLPKGAEGDRMEIDISQVPENKDSLQAFKKETPNIPPASKILRTWRSQNPGLGFMSGKAAALNLTGLFTTLKKNGCTIDSLETTDILTCIFGSKPNSRFKHWIEDIKEQIEIAREGVFSDIKIESASPIDRNDFIDERAVEIYQELVIRGVTPADLNMSLIEHANNRSYSERFPVLDTTKLPKL